jgi:hypothetical protein
MQKTTALSTAEAEYYSASSSAAEILYLRDLPDRVGFVQQAPTPVYYYEDNTACIEWGNKVIGGRERPAERAKHIDIQKYFAHKVIQKGHIISHDACPRSNFFPADRHLDQAAALPAMASV